MQLASVSTRGARADHRASDGRDLIEWAEPVIADRVREFYSFAVPGREAQTLALEHRQVWRSLLLAKPVPLDRSRRQLRRLGEEAGLPAGFADALDLEIVEELFDIVLLRYRASRDQVRRFSFILMAAAADLGAARAASERTAAS